jgi:NADH:ubiquinone oxidoreductase subunit H
VLVTLDAGLVRARMQASDYTTITVAAVMMIELFTAACLTLSDERAITSCQRYSEPSTVQIVGLLQPVTDEINFLVRIPYIHPNLDLFLSTEPVLLFLLWITSLLMLAQPSMQNSSTLAALHVMTAKPIVSVTVHQAESSSLLVQAV